MAAKPAPRDALCVAVVVFGRGGRCAVYGLEVVFLAKNRAGVDLDITPFWKYRRGECPAKTFAGKQ